MSLPSTDQGRGRVALPALIALLLVVAVVAVIVVRTRSGIRAGSALDVGGGGGILQPLPPDTPLSLGIARITNVSDESVELVDARLLRLDPELELLGFSVLPSGPGPWGPNPPITALEHPLPGAVPISQFPSIPPGDRDTQAVVMFGLTVKPGKAGKAVGIELLYRQGGKLRTQVVEEQVYVCWVPSLAGADCPGVEDEMAVFGEFEDEVKGRPSRPPF